VGVLRHPTGLMAPERLIALRRQAAAAGPTAVTVIPGIIRRGRHGNDDPEVEKKERREREKTKRDETKEERKERRARKKERRKRKEEKNEEKKDKKRKRSQSDDSERKKKKHKPESDAERGMRDKKQALADLLELDFVYLTAPIRRHSITEVVASDIKGHTTVTTVTKDTVKDMAAYCKRINKGDFARCYGDRPVRIEIDGRVFGCHLNRETKDVNLYPISGPTCTTLGRQELNCLVYLRDAKKIDFLAKRNYLAGEILEARKALLAAGIEISDS